MHRFLIFPLILTAAVIPLPEVTFLQSLFPLTMLDGHFPTLWGTTRDLDVIWTITLPYCIALGLALGIGLAVFDWFHNHTRPRSNVELISRLLANLWWCGFYVGTITVLNSALSVVVSKAVPPLFGLGVGTRWLFAVPLITIALLNLSAILWASIRSITQSDTLTPRRLKAKLQRSTHLQA